MTNTDTGRRRRHRGAGARVLAAAGSEVVRVTVNTREAAKAVPEIRRRMRDSGHDAPLVGDFHYNGHTLLTEFPDCAAALDKYRINPGNVGVGAQHDDNFGRMIEVAVAHGKPVRIGVNWGSLDRALLTSLMDENARRPDPREDREVVLEAMGERAALGRAGGAFRTAARPHHPVGQGERRARPGRGVSSARLVVRLPAAPRAHRSGPGRQGHRRDHGGAIGAALRRHRRYDPHQPHARAGRRSRGGGADLPADPPVARDPALRAPGHVVPRLRAHDQHVLPGAGGRRHRPHPAAHPGVARHLSRRRAAARWR